MVTICEIVEKDSASSFFPPAPDKLIPHLVSGRNERGPLLDLLCRTLQGSPTSTRGEEEHPRDSRSLGARSRSQSLPPPPGTNLTKPCQLALNTLYRYTRARPPSRTLVDPLAAFIITYGADPSNFLAAVDAANEAAESTRSLEATAGRAACVYSLFLLLREWLMSSVGMWIRRRFRRRTFLMLELGGSSCCSRGSRRRFEWNTTCLNVCDTVCSFGCGGRRCSLRDLGWRGGKLRKGGEKGVSISLVVFCPVC